MVNHTPAKFDGCKHRGRGDIMILVCHVISQDHVTKGSNSIMGRSPSNPAKFGGHRHCGSGYVTISFCHVILQDLVIKGSCDFVDRISSR